MNAPDSGGAGPSASGRHDPVPAGWTLLPAEHLPRPTFWPAGLALGITFVFWGLISSWVVGAVGWTLSAVSLAGWVRNLRHER